MEIGRRIVVSDCLDVMGRIPDESVNLIYADPPFNVGMSFGEFDDRWESDDEYLAYMDVRIREMHRILKPTGSLWLHCDWRMNSYLRVLLDCVFGGKSLRNEVVWAYTGPGSSRSRQFNRKHDTIWWYSKGAGWVFNVDDVRMPYSMVSEAKPGAAWSFGPAVFDPSGGANGKSSFALGGKNSSVAGTKSALEANGGFDPSKSSFTHGGGGRHDKSRSKLGKEGHNGQRLTDEEVEAYLRRGKNPEDWWADIPAGGQISSRERAHGSYPTQKPLKLLERIIKACSNPGDLVFDPFCGSGTTLVAALSLGREFVGCDINEEAVRITRERLYAASESGRQRSLIPNF